jgi:hypothetical protein
MIENTMDGYILFEASKKIDGRRICWAPAGDPENSIGDHLSYQTLGKHRAMMLPRIDA